jgi:guanyl-specific ribonuclease Sa
VENNKMKFWAGIAIAFILGWGISFFFHTKSVTIEDKRYVTSNVVETQSAAADVSVNEKTTQFPDYALETLEYIREHKEAPAGYIGGRVFQNRENQLPKTDEKGAKINYQEWDVHPKQNGKNRGAERLVTSSLGEAYFTSDHYRSFQKVN